MPPHLICDEVSPRFAHTKTIQRRLKFNTRQLLVVLPLIVCPYEVKLIKQVSTKNNSNAIFSPSRQPARAQRQKKTACHKSRVHLNLFFIVRLQANQRAALYCEERGGARREAASLGVRFSRVATRVRVIARHVVRPSPLARFTLYTFVIESTLNI